MIISMVSWTIELFKHDFLIPSVHCCSLSCFQQIVCCVFCYKSSQRKIFQTSKQNKKDKNHTNPPGLQNMTLICKSRDKKYKTLLIKQTEWGLNVSKIKTTNVNFDLQKKHNSNSLRIVF